jgi:hypothetical protein
VVLRQTTPRVNASLGSFFASPISNVGRVTAIPILLLQLCHTAQLYSYHNIPVVATMTVVEKNIEEEVEQREEKVVHDYHDYSNEIERVDESVAAEPAVQLNRGEENFPVKLHYMLTELETDGMADVVAWQPHGRCFLVHKQQQFVEQVLPL